MVNARPISFLILVAFHSFKLVSSASDDQFSFEGFAGANLALDGAANVTPNGLLALTNDKHTKGHAFYPTPLRSRLLPNGTMAARSFSATFVFAIVSEHAQLSDHGLAFMVAPNRNLSAATGAQYLGLLNINDNGKASNHVLAVELDTVLSPEFHDINSNHVGVDVNSLQSTQSRAAGYYDDSTGAFLNLTLMSREAMQVWVDYDGHATELNVTLAPVGVLKPKKPLLSTTVDLSTVVMDTVYVGFSSATGLSVAYHYVLGWSFSLDGVAPALNYSNLPVLPRLDQRRHRNEILVIILPIATAAFVVALLAVVFMLVRRSLRYAELREDWEIEYGPHRFSYKDLFHATEGFGSKHLLGVGGFGRVYRGVLSVSNLEIAVKRMSHDSRQGVKEFIAEVVSMGRLRHRNLVQLLGYCRRRGELLIVYDYMSNGSLDKHLHDKSRPVLDWTLRFHIIKGIASGLLYLHEDWEQVVIHRDIKASNVLLDSEMNGCLGDFGLAKLYDHGANSRTTHIVGTRGYLSPELLRTGKASPATDVFAFGMFLLEVVCGRRPLEHEVQEDDQVVLLDWVLTHWNRGAILDTVDPRLTGEYTAEEASLVLKLGLLCSQPLPSARPSMRQVLQYLHGTLPVPEMSLMNLNYGTLMFVQNERFEAYTMLNTSSQATSVDLGSDLSGGR